MTEGWPLGAGWLMFGMLVAVLVYVLLRDRA